jgi:hypothetical protein
MLVAVGMGLTATSLSACGGSEDAEAAHALCTDWSWDPSLSDTDNAAALEEVMNAYDYSATPDNVIGRAKKECHGHFAKYDAYAADLSRQGAQANGTTGDPESADNGPTQYTADSFSIGQRSNFLVTLKGVEPRLAGESDDTLLNLGAEVCEAFSNGNSREDVINLLTSISDWDGMEAARLTVAADRSLC